MKNTRCELDLLEAVLELVEKRRAESGDPTLGAALEETILATQVAEIERDILDDPGAIEPWLIRTRRRPD
jgi:hypothetical protein